MSSRDLLAHVVERLVADWRAGRPVPSEFYLMAHRALAADREAAIELILHEYELRCEGVPDAAIRDEFLTRFRDYRPDLDDALDVYSIEEDLGWPEPPPSGAETDGDASDARAWPLVEGYSIEARLGEGASSVVYRAKQLKFNRDVALKLIKPGRSPGLGTHEAEAIVHLDHPRIVQVFDIGQYAGATFLSMKLFAGGTLKDHLSEFGLFVLAGQFPSPSRRVLRRRQEEIAREMAAVAGAVDHAHRRLVLHRDLKPDNL
jgi:serine/threonine protein kinase